MNPASIHSLTTPEVRVLGCLIEKQRTTPDAYPLSLNSLRLACNQSTNRDPVVEYDEAVIREALDRLERRGLTRLASGAGSRAAKYRHLLADALPMDAAEQAVMCVLMLRGPQTPGELKQRGERLHAFAGLAEVDQTLERLIARSLVARRERRPGQKEERYAQLLDGEARETAAEAVADASPAHEVGLGGREGQAPDGTERAGEIDAMRSLEARVARLEREMAELREGARAPAAGERVGSERSESTYDDARIEGRV